MIEVEEVLYRWLKGVSARHISKSMGISRNTIKKMITQAQSVGLTANSQPEDIAKYLNLLNAINTKSRVNSGEAYNYLVTQHEQIDHWRQMPHMTVRQMVRLFKENNACVSESSLHRYIVKHFPIVPQSTVHLTTKPGWQAQVDFCYVGLMTNPNTKKNGKAYAFIMILSHSRYRFVRFVFKQDTATWIDCHIRAFHFFGGVPETIMLDNLKAGILNANIYDPVLNRSYGELARHYGFVCDANKVRTPKHKGKVERSVVVIRQQLLAGKNYQDIEAANIAALHWCRYEIAMRVTRSTGRTPWDIFNSEEKIKLKALPATDYECALWQELKVHRDHHLVFAGSFYSMPTQYIGQMVWVRSTKRIIEVYSNNEKIKTHVRASKKGQWITDSQDYPKSKAMFLNRDKEYCLQQGQQIGPFTALFLEKVLDISTMTSQRKAHAILRLANNYSNMRLELACQRSILFDNYTYRSLKTILNCNYDKANSNNYHALPHQLNNKTSYLRSTHEFIPIGERI